MARERACSLPHPRPPGVGSGPADPPSPAALAGGGGGGCDRARPGPTTVQPRSTVRIASTSSDDLHRGARAAPLAGGRIAGRTLGPTAALLVPPVGWPERTLGLAARTRPGGSARRWIGAQPGSGARPLPAGPGSSPGVPVGALAVSLSLGREVDGRYREMSTECADRPRHGVAGTGASPGPVGAPKGGDARPTGERGPCPSRATDGTRRRRPAARGTLVL
jgi:hypothetical protein